MRCGGFPPARLRFLPGVVYNNSYDVGATLALGCRNRFGVGPLDIPGSLKLGIQRAWLYSEL